MNIMAIESSCDETAVAIVRDGREVLTDCIASQVELHRIYGGVVPEIASRKHIEAIYGLADQALEKAGLTRDQIDAVAVTYAPGLITGKSRLHQGLIRKTVNGLDVLSGRDLRNDTAIDPMEFHLRGNAVAEYFPTVADNGNSSLITGGFHS